MNLQNTNPYELRSLVTTLVGNFKVVYKEGPLYLSLYFSLYFVFLGRTLSPFMHFICSFHRAFTRCIGSMSYIYGRAKVIRKNKQLLVGQSDIEEFFRKNRNYDMLSEVWTLWRQAAGRPLRGLFKKLVTIQTGIAKRYS